MNAAIIIDYFTRRCMEVYGFPRGRRARLLNHDRQRANSVGARAAAQRHCRAPSRGDLERIHHRRQQRLTAQIRQAREGCGQAARRQGAAAPPVAVMTLHS